MSAKSFLSHVATPSPFVPPPKSCHTVSSQDPPPLWLLSSSPPRSLSLSPSQSPSQSLFPLPLPLIFSLSLHIFLSTRPLLFSSFSHAYLSQLLSPPLTLLLFLMQFHLSPSPPSLSFPNQARSPHDPTAADTSSPPAP